MTRNSNIEISQWGDPSAIITDRACGDLRRGLPVVISQDQRAIIVIACEELNKKSLGALRATHQALETAEFGTEFGVLISDKRADTLKIATKGRRAVLINHDSDWTDDSIRAIADPTLDLSYPLKGPFEQSNRPDTNIEQAAIKLLKIANLLPACLVIIGQKNEIEEQLSGQEILHISAAGVDQYDKSKLYETEEVARTTVPLMGANNCSIISFRPRSGGVENIAIIINNPDLSKPVLTRLHSECFTGDLLGSLKCDCGNQLQGAIAEIEKAGGGVLLYLAQEGRGVGLSAKLKAYTLQEQGFDTVDANLRLGFEVDERLYAPAGKILKKLNINAIELMTNNPKKVEAMKSLGINVVKRVSHQFPTNQHNENYLNTKRDRTGHIIS